MKNLLSRSMVNVMVLGTALIIGAMGAVGYSTLRLARSGRCSFTGTLRMYYHRYRLLRYHDAFRRANVLVKRDPAGFDLWSTPHGHFWVPKGNNSTLPLELAEQAVHIYGTPRFSVRRGDIVLDCGASVGVYAIGALNAGAQQVVAIEPAPDNVECLRRNFRREIDAGRVVLYPKGVWDRDDQLTLRLYPGFSGGDSLVLQQNRVASGVSVPLTTVDRIVEELRLKRVDFIKMDIEGAEQRALAGAQRVIAKFHPRLAISVYHQGDDFEKVPSLVRTAYPAYRMQCGPCGFESGQFRPEFLYFQ